MRSETHLVSKCMLHCFLILSVLTSGVPAADSLKFHACLLEGSIPVGQVDLVVIGKVCSSRGQSRLCSPILMVVGRRLLLRVPMGGRIILWCVTALRLQLWVGAPKFELVAVRRGMLATRRQHCMQCLL